VAAFDVGNPAVASEAFVDVRRVPFFWQTWWFLSLSVVMLSLLAWAIYKGRMHQIRLRFRAVLDERGRLAREMHDTVIQGCTSISALLEAIASSQAGNQFPQEHLLGYARIQAQTTINEARHAVWNLRHEDEPALDLAASLDAISLQTRKEFSVPVTCTVEGDQFFVPGSIARELLMVVREAVYNAVLHGHPREIAISVRYEPKELILIVTDSGIGFNTNEAPAEGHFGITGMRERMERLGGTLDLSSIPGTGTRVELSLQRSIVLSETGNRHRWAMRWNLIK
jgi:signal transduction histidine kinase